MHTREDIADIAAKAVRKITNEIMRVDGMPVNEPWVQVVLDEAQTETRKLWLSSAKVSDEALDLIRDLSAYEISAAIEDTMRPDILRALAPMRPS